MCDPLRGLRQRAILDFGFWIKMWVHLLEKPKIQFRCGTVDSQLVSTNTLNRPSLLFVAESRSPLTPLNKGGTKVCSKSTPTPLPPWGARGGGDLGGSRLGYNPDLDMVSGLT